MESECSERKEGEEGQPVWKEKKTDCKIEEDKVNRMKRHGKGSEKTMKG